MLNIKINYLMKVLGINAYHGDASACIFIDNKLVAAAEEERFTRVKHSAGFPKNAIRFCLNFANINLSEIEHIAINRNPKQKVFSKLLFASSNIFNINFIKNRLKNLQKINSLKEEFVKNFNEKVNAKIHNIDHHISHVASSVYFSNFEKTNFISVDGFGDFASTMTGYYNGKKIKIFDEVLFPHSLGLFYTAITQYLGFLKYGDEYKVMGLASYGKPIFCEKIRNMFEQKTNKLFSLNLKYFLHHTGNVEMTWLSKEPKIGKVYSDALIDLLGPQREPHDEIKKFHIDIAASAQKIYEEFLTSIANKLYKQNPSEFLCLSGGCAMNSVANGNLYKNTDYKKIYIPASPGDAGGSVGAASVVIKNTNHSLKFSDNPYLGPFFSNKEILKILEENKFKIESTTDFGTEKIKINFFTNINDLLKLTAEKIYQRNIIGFYNGRMEWGPRALGNRSILADPRDKNIRSVLNIKIKRREEFRPFAPSILKEKVREWFVYDDNVPFMSKVIEIREDKRSLVPAITHIDGTGRLQTVTEAQNKNYYNLIKFFFQLSGIPMVLNTSFNENEPIVCSPQEALDCFLRTKMDCLVLENYLITRITS
jgi:carbamoyltransferase